MRYTKSKLPYLVILFVLSGTALVDRLVPQDDAIEITISAMPDEVPSSTGSILARVPAY